MSNMKSCFCLLNCFNNYEIVSSKIIEFYIQNATDALSSSKVKVSQFYEVTPYIIYTWYILANAPNIETGNIKRSKQFSDFILILSLAAVTLARIANSDATVFGAQGVVTNPGFSTMYTLANQLNKVTAYWTDDLRNLWGTSDDPLFIGMAPLPYKYLWLSGNTPGLDEKFNVQPKGMNGQGVIPNLASSKNLCPTVKEGDVEGRWNTFIELLQRGESIQSQNQAGVSKRTQNLITLGNAIIKYIEHDKDTAKFVPGGWNPTKNYTLYWDMESIINQNNHLLYSQEQQFIAANMEQKLQDQPQQALRSSLHPIHDLHKFKNQPLINPSQDHALELASTLGTGLAMMMESKT